MKALIRFLEILVSMPVKALIRIGLRRIERKEKEARALHEQVLQKLRDGGAPEQEIRETDNQFTQIVDHLKQEEREIRDQL